MTHTPTPWYQCHLQCVMSQSKSPQNREGERKCDIAVHKEASAAGHESGTGSSARTTSRRCRTLGERDRENSKVVTRRRPFPLKTPMESWTQEGLSLYPVMVTELTAF